ncbi:alpha/beta hydrolase [Aestuariirhabdus sp. Z084]|uniref:alpha/beta fold hydrolase n=1 Tax=Aestuariirhabdus haliotis TaxID=2918751 RepID=UPI00201B37B0|nr:alpha/beta hydrolase [Aestuariirhabdus haliotis]MCL6417804.1 alpha/beta hydrolase [Aestuariirhabdus haliotis]MCL6421729.1 alpha/beta hydrolase [Aestuariirhabdus haliotis]
MKNLLQMTISLILLIFNQSTNATETNATYQYSSTATQSISTNGVTFAYRELGVEHQETIILLNHFLAVIDDWDPAIVDGLATEYRVIVFDNEGLGGSTGTVDTTIDGMADNAANFIKALELSNVHVFGFSMGGFVAQSLAHKYPDLVSKLVLAGTGPSNIANTHELPNLLKKSFMYAQKNNKHRKNFLFFTQSKESQIAADEFVSRLGARIKSDRVKRSDQHVVAAHVGAIQRWAKKGNNWLSNIQQPTLIINGDKDIMVDTKYSFELHKVLPNSQMSIYPNAGHGAIFQYHDLFVKQVLAFL